MEANELMIGDFVLDGNVYAQVTSITCDGNIETTHNEHSNIELIEPIPLTQEILEKNGFRLKWDYDIKLMVCDDIVIEIGVNYKKYEDGKMYLRKMLAPLYNVHQLQHAFRLCGIKKEIIL